MGNVGWKSVLYNNGVFSDDDDSVEGIFEPDTTTDEAFRDAMGSILPPRREVIHNRRTWQMRHELEESTNARARIPKIIEREFVCQDTNRCKDMLMWEDLRMADERVQEAAMALASIEKEIIDLTESDEEEEGDDDDDANMADDENSSRLGKASIEESIDEPPSDDDNEEGETIWPTPSTASDITMLEWNGVNGNEVDTATDEDDASIATTVDKDSSFLDDLDDLEYLNDETPEEMVEQFGYHRFDFNLLNQLKEQLKGDKNKENNWNKYVFEGYSPDEGVVYLVFESYDDYKICIDVHKDWANSQEGYMTFRRFYDMYYKQAIA